MNGWHQATILGVTCECWLFKDGEFGGYTAEKWKEIGVKLEPVIVMTKDEYDKAMDQAGDAGWDAAMDTVWAQQMGDNL